MAGFRSLIVHDYARVDNTKAYDILMKHVCDFDAFVEAMRASLAGE